MSNYKICYSCDRKYVEQISASIASTLINSEIEDEIDIYVLENELQDKDKKKHK